MGHFDFAAMKLQPHEQDLEPSLPEKSRRSRMFAKAGLAGLTTLVLMFGLMRVYHPLITVRHLDRVLAQCGGGALIAFFASLIIDSFKNPQDTP